MSMQDGTVSFRFLLFSILPYSFMPSPIENRNYEGGLEILEDFKNAYGEFNEFKPLITHLQLVQT